MTTSSASNVTPKTIDLSWVEFSEEEDQCCESLLGCSKQAVWKSVFQSDCPCEKSEWFFCEDDGLFQERYYAAASRGWGIGKCIMCNSPMKVLRHFRYRKV